MYLCDVCGLVSLPGQARLLHVTYRPDGSIERERPVCMKCKAGLGTGRGEIEARKGRRLPPAKAELTRVNNLLGVPVQIGRPSKRKAL